MLMYKSNFIIVWLLHAYVLYTTHELQSIFQLDFFYATYIIHLLFSFSTTLTCNDLFFPTFKPDFYMQICY